LSNSNRQKASLKFLFLVSFTCQMITGAVSITVPIYANFLGASTLLVGIIGSAGGLIYSFLPFVSGKLCDRLNRKAMVSASLILYGCACLFYNFVDEASLLVYVRILEWTSVAIFWPATETLIADSGDMRLEDALTRFNISWGLAMVVGPVIGGQLISGLSIKAPFIFSAIIAFTFGVLSFIIINEESNVSSLDSEKKITQKEPLKTHYSLLPGLASIFLFSSIGGILFSIFPAYATDLGIPAFEIGWITFASSATRVLAFHQANRVEEKLGKKGMFLSGSLFLGLAVFLTAGSKTFPLFMLCFAFFGVGAGLSYAASISLILGRWESSRGHGAGIFESLIGVGYFAGPLVGGIVSQYAANAPYLYGIVLSVVVFCIQLLFKPKS
jgi:DHA1 family multidrug resistance protein-like MFS transporter